MSNVILHKFTGVESIGVKFIFNYGNLIYIEISSYIYLIGGFL